MERVEKPVFSANSEPINVFGKLRMLISIDNTVYNEQVDVADISVDAIMGLDFLIVTWLRQAIPK
jgi:hypothetical protein